MKMWSIDASIALSYAQMDGTCLRAVETAISETKDGS